MARKPCLNLVEPFARHQQMLCTCQQAKIAQPASDPNSRVSQMKSLFG